MDRYPGLFIAVLVLAADALPCFISLLLACDTTYLPATNSHRRRLMFLTAGSCVVVHLLVYTILHKYLQGSWNMLITFWRIAKLNFPYQAIPYVPISLTVRLVFALVIGMLWRRLLSSQKISAAPLYPSKKRISVLFSLLLVGGVLSIGTLNYSLTAFRNITLNEIGSYNTSTALDESELITDYIELYNRGHLDFDTTGLYLSDDAGYLFKKPIPSEIIPAGGYLIVRLDSNELSLRKEGGETVYLSTDSGTVVDQITTIPVEANYAYCRVSENSEEWAILSATPGISNLAGTAMFEELPSFSHPSGFYEDAFDLQILAPENTTIYYTLDGSVPTTTSAVYTEPIRVYNRSDEPNTVINQQRVVENWQEYTPYDEPVDKAFIIRAIAVDDSGALSKPVTATYFVDMEHYAQTAVVSLVADPEDLWGENGIYVTGAEYDQWYLNGGFEAAPLANFYMYGKSWERPAHLDYLSDTLSFGQEVGLRVSGGSSRSNAKKSFNIYAREEYSGSDFFIGSFWDKVLSKRIKIRGGYAHSVCQMLVRDRNFGTQQVQRVAVFLNGEFFYNTNIFEKYDAEYMFAHYGVNPNNVVILQEGSFTEGSENDRPLLQEIYDYLQTHDMSSQDAYTGFGEIVDLQSYIDYMCFNIYIDNMDFTEVKNSIWWRSREKTHKPYEDGKWRFLLYDLDAMEWNDSHLFSLNTSAEKNTFSLMPRFTNNCTINNQPIFSALKNNPAFIQNFSLTFMDMVNTNFRYENVLAAMDSYGRDIKYYHGGNGGTQRSEYYESFFQNRASYIVPYMAEEFGLTGTLETLTLSLNDPASGSLVLNTITPDMCDGQWQGQYYTDYPITVTAVPRDGYTFVGWEGSIVSQDTSIQVTLTKGGTCLNAIFEKQAG